MRSTQRFPRARLRRAVKEIMELAYWFNPGDPWRSPENYWRTTHQQKIRQENRAADFDCIADRAQALLDALDTLRR